MSKPDPQFDGATVIFVVLVCAALLFAALWSLGLAFAAKL